MFVLDPTIPRSNVARAASSDRGQFYFLCSGH